MPMRIRQGGSASRFSVVIHKAVCVLYNNFGITSPFSFPVLPQVLSRIRGFPEKVRENRITIYLH